MDSESKPGGSRRIGTAVTFLAGMLLSLSALRDAKVLWPPDEVWRALQPAQRLELWSGIALITIAIVISAVRRSEQ